MYSLVTSIFLYACDPWPLTEELQRAIRAMEMSCYRKILHISYKDHVINEKIRVKIQLASGPHLLIIVKRRKLQWYGHVSRLAKTILQGSVKRVRKQGRQRKRWEDNIWEWTGWRVRGNREQWRKLVEKSSMMPQWHLSLRDRWRWRCRTYRQSKCKDLKRLNERVKPQLRTVPLPLIKGRHSCLSIVAEVSNLLVTCRFYSDLGHAQRPHFYLW